MSLSPPLGATLSQPEASPGAFSQSFLCMSLTAFPMPLHPLDVILVRRICLEIRLLVARGTSVTPSPGSPGRGKLTERFHSEAICGQSHTV